MNNNRSLTPEEIFQKNYTIGEQLGEGKQGSVFKLTRNKDNKKFAAKLIETNNPVKTLLEYEVQMKAENNCTLRTYEYYVMSDSVVIIMDLLDGIDLTKLYEKYHKKSDYLKICLDIFFQLALCLKFLHSKGIAHRDIKRENIIYNYTSHGGQERSDIGQRPQERSDIGQRPQERSDTTGQAKIIDFGLAIDFSINPGSAQLLSGTGIYLSPDYIKAVIKKNVTFPVLEQQDYWALCVLLYYLLYNKPPFEAIDRQSLIHDILDREHMYSPIASEDGTPSFYLDQLFSGKNNNVYECVTSIIDYYKKIISMLP